MACYIDKGLQIQGINIPLGSQRSIIRIYSSITVHTFSSQLHWSSFIGSSSSLYSQQLMVGGTCAWLPMVSEFWPAMKPAVGVYKIRRNTFDLANQCCWIFQLEPLQVDAIDYRNLQCRLQELACIRQRKYDQRDSKNCATHIGWPFESATAGLMRIWKICHQIFAAQNRAGTYIMSRW